MVDHQMEEKLKLLDGFPMTAAVNKREAYCFSASPIISIFLTIP